jgi:hypothetical protein
VQRDQRWLACWSCEELVHFLANCPYGREVGNGYQHRKRDDRPPRGTWEPTKRSEWWLETTDRQTGEVANHWEMSRCQWKKENTNVHIKGPHHMMSSWKGLTVF